MAKSKRNINLSLGQFQDALAIYRADGRAGDREAELLEWLWRYAHKELDGDPGLLATRLGMTWAPIYKTLKGTYEAGLENFCERVEILKRRVEQGHVSSFVHTPITRRIWAALDYARDMGTMTLACGPTGSSKTETAQEWARANNHGRTTYVRVPEDCTKTLLIREIAEAMGIPPRRKDTAALGKMITKGMGPRKVLILDEFGHMVPTHSKRSEGPVEFVRTLLDTTHCAVGLIVTDVYYEAMLSGPKSAFMEQFMGRISYFFQMPKATVYRGEVEAMIRLYGGVEPTEKMYKVGAEIAKSNRGRLRTLCADLRKAVTTAKGAEKPLTWQFLEGAKNWREAGGSMGQEEVA
jgi:hypothetical protein